MIAAKPLQDMTRKLGRNAFDLPVATLAGLAAAVVAFAIPADLLGHMVSATGLPHLLAAAEPPLGLKARGAIGIAGALAAFGFVLMTMRMLDGASRRKATGQAEPVAEIDERDRPRLRRRDLHPDAPICRPISATRDFGEPSPPSLEAPPAQEPAEDALPSWLAEAELEPVAQAPDSKPEIESEAAFAPDREQGASVEPLPEALIEAQPEPLIEARPDPVSLPVGEASIADLMRRLEQGLSRRRTPHVFTPPQQPAAPPAPQVFPEANDDRLQSAIESLQRFAARGE